MAIKARLKFRGDMPWELENKLVTRFGFYIHSRGPGPEKWVILEKRTKTHPPEVLINGQLPEEVQNILIKRCNVICSQFIDPDAHEYTIRARLNNIANTLPPYQKKFIHDWIKNNIGEE